MLPEDPGPAQPWSATPRPGSAAEAANRLISELSAGGGLPVPPAADAGPELTDLPPPVVEAAPAVAPAAEAACAGSEDARRTRGDRRGRRGSGRLLVLVAVAVLLLAGYLVTTQVLDGARAPSVAAVPSPSAAPSQRTAAPSQPSAALAASLQDPHFRHGYDAGLRRAGIAPVPAAEREQVCRNLGLDERTRGYPWGAHDRAGCLAGVTSRP